MWGHRPESGYTAGTSLAGYKVEASDGHIGKVDKHNDEVDASYLVVDTGVWIFGKHVLLPAGTITRVDSENEVVHVALTKEQIKNSPEFDKDKHLDDRDHHTRTGDYYGNNTPPGAPGTGPAGTL
ncbi:PRC-barrel domain-containing protein [Streptomyces sp. SID3343]|uniref:PRC-barrel domain-containing protein n=1 Tax=Streptomyces sp. SID3343 TaxID=2690260 RepID=UPI0013715412|nr:PRC-barrel domain-containing protein [Streptomyces sp. SID3343]MYW02687.1 PRC-barrel domain containing protein [Streptomyces sp. SID3343]